MKKFLQFFMVITMLSFTFVSCGDDDDDLNLNIDENTAEYNNKTYKIYGAAQTLYLSNNNIDISLYLDEDKDDNNCILLEMGIPSGNKTLPAGTYSFYKMTEEDEDDEDDEDDYKYNPWIFTSYSYISINANDKDITGGTVKVTVNSGTYEIQVSCSVEGNQSVIAYYKGKLETIQY